MANDYEAAGRLLAYGLVHRGPLPCFFHPIFYDNIVNYNNDKFDVDDIPYDAIQTCYRQQIESVSVLLLTGMSQ